MASKWGFDEEFEQAVEWLAETPITSEQVGIHADQLVDTLILAARAIVARETAVLAFDKVGIE